jgi:hypothetical protein
MRASAISMSVCGASYARVMNASGAGSAFRSTLPFGVSGIASRRTYAAGTMYSGSAAARCVRSAWSSVSSEA